MPGTLDMISNFSASLQTETTVFVVDVVYHLSFIILLHVMGRLLFVRLPLSEGFGCKEQDVHSGFVMERMMVVEMYLPAAL